MLNTKPKLNDLDGNVEKTLNEDHTGIKTEFKTRNGDKVYPFINTMVIFLWCIIEHDISIICIIVGRKISGIFQFIQR